MNLTDRELEILSAFLDGEISNKDREMLEARLSEDEGFKKSFEELLQTRQVIRSLPSLRAPRNYFVSPEMVGQKETPSRAFPILRFASILASVIFVLLFMGDILIPRSGAAPTLLAGQVSESIIEEAETESALPEMAAEEPAPAEGESIESQAAEAPLFASEPSELQADQPMEMPAAEEEAPAPEPLPPNVSPSEAPADTERMAATGVPAPLEDAGDELGEAMKLIQEPSLLKDGGVISIPLGAPSTQSTNFWMVVRYLEYFFVAVALATGFTAIMLFRKSKNTP